MSAEPFVCTPLRDAVLQGRFIGRDSAPTDVARFVTTQRPAVLLTTWFGTEELARLFDCPQTLRLVMLRAALDRDIVAIDRLLSRQLDAVLLHPRLLQLEGRWRGLAWLVSRLPSRTRQEGRRVELKLLSMTWAEVCRDIERAPEFDQSLLFHKIYQEEFDTPGGKPYGLIAADYEVRHRPDRLHPTDDVATIRGLAGIAAAAFAPIVLGAAPALIGLERFADLNPSFNVTEMFSARKQEYQRWRDAAKLEDMRFIGIALPRVLGRAPWADDGTRNDGFRFSHAPLSAAQRVWTSPVYGHAAVAIRAFEANSWLANMRGADIDAEARAGIVDALPVERFPSDIADEVPRAPVEVALTDEQESQFAEGRFVVLAALEQLPEACFGAMPSLHEPPKATANALQANQRLSSQLNSLLCVSRFAHCVKLWGHDMIGSLHDAQEIEKRLQDWLNPFCGGSSISEKHPLSEARVEVRERKGRPGTYNCILHLQPHLQQDEIGAAFRLVTEFASQSAVT